MFHSFITKRFAAIILSLFIAYGAMAQPSAALVKSDFMKNGVTAVEGIVISKEWYKDHYLWKASLRTVLPVKPEEADGLKGVTLVRHVVAHYECTGSQCRRTWNGLVYSEYKGINLPVPSAVELNTLLKKEAANNPSAFFRSMSGKLDITDVGVHPTAPKYEWINPKKLSFNAWKKNREEASYTEIALVETPLLVTLQRDGLQSPWRISFITEVREQLVEISRSNKNDAANTGIQTVQFSGDETKNKTEMTRLNVPTPPKFTTPEAAANDAYTMLFNLTREQYYYYLSAIISPEFRCTGCAVTLNENGKQRVNAILTAAYDGNGNFRDQFCLSPSFSFEGSAAYFNNRRNDINNSSFFMIDKVNEFFCINSGTLRVSKDAAENTQLKNISCSNTPAAAATGGNWKPGDKVMVEENGKWYAATVLQAQTGKWFIHYDGYNSKYDLWVGPDRIRNK